MLYRWRRPLINMVLALLAPTAAAQNPSQNPPSPPPEPSIRVAEPLTFRADGDLSFLVYANRATIDDVHAEVREVKDPVGKTQNPATFVVEPAKQTVRREGTVFRIKPATNAMPAFGDYKFTIIFQFAVDKKDFSQVAAATISYPKPTVTIPMLRDGAVEIKGQPRASNVSVEIVNSGPVLPDVTVVGAAVTSTADPKIIVPGTAVFLQDDGKPLSKISLPSGVTKGNLSLSGYDRAGTFQSKLFIITSDAGVVEEIPYKIVISDGWSCAALTIGAGVFLAFLAHWIANRLRPEKENKLLALRIADDIATVRGRTREPARVAQLRALEDRLRTAQRGTVQQMKAALELIANDLVAASKAISDETVAAQDEKAKVQTLLASLRDRARDAGGDIQKRLEDLDERYRSAEAHIAALMFGTAKTELSEIKMAAEKLKGDMPDRRFTDDGETTTAAAEIEVVENAEFRKAGTPLTFQYKGSEDAQKVQWRFDGERGGIGPHDTHTFESSGNHLVKATLPSGTIRTLSVYIAESDLTSAIKEAERNLLLYDLLLSAIALVVAVATGLWLLYTPPFGTASQYLQAFVWGFGVDNSVRGFGAVLTKVGAP